MARILFAWELGAGLGHAHNLLQLSRHPALASHTIIIAMPVPSPAAQYMLSLGVPFVRSPGAAQTRPPHAPSARQFRARNYADILAWSGYADAQVLRTQIEAWRRLLDETAPDLVIANFAPTLLLAARDRATAIAVGNGFTVPPDHLPEYPDMPTLHDGKAGAPLMPQAQIHALIGKVLHDDPQPSPTLPGWFRTTASIALVYPQLDPYDELRDRAADGPLNLVTGALPQPASPHVFAYLSSNYPALDSVLDALESLPASVSVCVRGATAQHRVRVGNLHWETLHDAFDVQQELSRSSLVVHHGSSHTAHATVQAGRPQLALPFHLENGLLTQRLLRLGVALDAGYREGHRLPGLLQRLLTEPAWAERARALAEVLSQSRWQGVERVITAARPWLGNPSPTVPDKGSAA